MSPPSEDAIELLSNPSTSGLGMLSSKVRFNETQLRFRSPSPNDSMNFTQKSYQMHKSVKFGKPVRARVFTPDGGRRPHKDLGPGTGQKNKLP